MVSQVTLGKVWFRGIILIIAFFFLALLFVSPPIRYSPAEMARSFNTFPDSSAKDSPTRELITLEYQKTIDEIKFRLEQQDSWYHYKFIFVGGLLALFLGQTGLLKGHGSASANISYGHLKSLLTADSNYAVIALACVLSLIVDMHIRSHMFAMQTLGLWIASYVEPSYFPVHPASGFYPWEQFIRNPNSPSMNLDSLYKLAFSTHLHFMTTIIYLLYMTVLQQICLTVSKTRSRARRQLILFGFLFVHLSALAFVFVAHAVSSTYEMLLIPINAWKNGWISTGYYILPWLGVVGLNGLYLRLLKSGKPERKDGRLSSSAA